MSLEELSAERQAVYGPWRDNMRGTSLAMWGLLVNYLGTQLDRLGPGATIWDVPCPDWLAPIFLDAVKLNRIASGNYKQDNFDDLRVYLSFVERMQQDGGS